ncbi:hypothetical protein X750_28180 [Mesorhizobium sp. LNJC394B00]|nr:hypothetical protein X750_28180 [Mesorhizobium sp. LNJC394B00]
MLGWSGPAIAMAFRFHLSDRNGKKLKQGLRRTMMTRLAVAKAVMHLFVPMCRDVGGHASAPTGSG